MHAPAPIKGHESCVRLHRLWLWRYVRAHTDPIPCGSASQILTSSLGFRVSGRLQRAGRREGRDLGQHHHEVLVRDVALYILPAAQMETCNLSTTAVGSRLTR